MTRLQAFTILAILGICGSAEANFQYVPGTNAAPPSGPAAPAPPPVTAMPIAPALPAPSSSSFSGGAVIAGFGTQVPLVIALREIVPASYQFGYADGINLGTLVNWKGGRPWRDVLNSVITPLGLTATEQNMVIYIARK